MPIFMYIDGGWTEVSTPKVHVNDSWVDLTEVMVSMSGSWISVWDANAISGYYYIVQSSDTAARINEAVTQLQEHATIIFGAGEWMITEPIIINRSNVTIQGTKNLTTLIRQFNSDQYVGMLQILGGSTNSLSNITIEGLTIDGNIQNGYTGSGIQGNYVGVSSQVVTSRDDSIAGIDSATKKGLTLKNCTVNNTSSVNIGLSNSAYSDIINNYCTSSESVGIALVNVTFSNINNNLISNVSYEGIHVESSAHLIIKGNTIQNLPLASGIWINVSRRILLNENNVKMNGYSDSSKKARGIRLTSSNENTIVSNVIVENNGTGIDLTSSNNNVISSNNIENNIVDGIGIYYSSYNSIIANTINNNDVGLYIADSSSYNIALSNITISNGYSGIYIDSTASENKVTNNI